MEKHAQRSLHAIAREVRGDWARVNYAAEPYLKAMEVLSSMEDRYAYEVGHQIVPYFLSNATGWRGPEARRIKAELKGMLGY